MTGSAPASLYDLLACPVCKVAIVRGENELTCASCARRFPIVDGVPILFADARAAEYQSQDGLEVRRGYLPWIERLVMQSLPPGAIVLDLGAGNRGFDLPHVIRMDTVLTPFVDVVADAHALPFLPGTLDFVFSLAVIEHLAHPFVAAEEMRRVLKRGGYVYGECNFVFPYHGYPSHFFNASVQGIEAVFASFAKLRSGVAPYQMPSFAIRSVLTTYRDMLQRLAPDDTRTFRRMLDRVCSQPLGNYDKYFSEGDAALLAAGVFFFGVNGQDASSEVIPDGIQDAWRRSPELQRRIPQLLDLGRVANVMLWAKSEAREGNMAIERALNQRATFRKREGLDLADLRTFEAEPAVEPAFKHIPDAETSAARRRWRRLVDRLRG